MKSLLVVLSLLIAGQANAQAVLTLSTVASVVAKVWPFNAPPVFVKVNGEGTNKQAALDDAFKNAVQTVTGIVVSADAEMVSDTLVRDDILKYSSGFIVSYELVSERQEGSLTVVEINARVAGNKIARRLLGRVDTKETVSDQTEQIYGQVSSTLNERRAGDALLTNLVKDYPRNSFVVALDKPQFEIDDNRNTVLYIPTSIKWSTQYLDALEDTVKYVAKDKCSAIFRCENSTRFNRGYFDSNRFSSYVMSDAKQSSVMTQGFDSRVMLEVKTSNVKGQSRISCVPLDLAVTERPAWERLIKQDYDNNTEFFRNQFKTVLVLPIENQDQIRNLHQVEAKVVKSCRESI